MNHSKISVSYNRDEIECQGRTENKLSFFVFFSHTQKLKMSIRMLYAFNVYVHLTVSKLLYGSKCPSVCFLKTVWEKLQLLLNIDGFFCEDSSYQ